MYPSKTKRKLVLRNTQEMDYTSLWYQSAFPEELITTSFVHFLLLEQIQQQCGEREVNSVSFGKIRGRFSIVPTIYNKNIFCKKKVLRYFPRIFKIWIYLNFFINLPHKFDPKSQALIDLYSLQRDTFVRMISGGVLTLQTP